MTPTLAAEWRAYMKLNRQAQIVYADVRECEFCGAQFDKNYMPLHRLWCQKLCQGCGLGLASNEDGAHADCLTADGFLIFASRSAIESDPTHRVRECPHCHRPLFMRQPDRHVRRCTMRPRPVAS